MEDKKLKRRQEIKLTISDLAFGGRGISKQDDLVFFVKDAIPGQRVSIFFTPEKTTKEFLEELNPKEEFVVWDWIAAQENYDYEFLDFNQDGSSTNFSSERGELLPKKYGRDTFQMGCAQLCGSGHSTMNKGDVFIVSPDEYQQWYFGQMWAKNSVIVEDDEGWDEEADEETTFLEPDIPIYVDNENGTTKIVFPNAKSLLEITANNHIFELADKVDKLLKTAFDSMN